MRRILGALTLGAAVAACGGAPPAATVLPSTAAPPTATTAPAPTTASASPTAAAAAATKPAAAAPTSTTAAPTNTAVPPTATRAAAKKYVVLKDGSSLKLSVNETLARIKLPSTAVLQTSDVGGQIVLDGDGNVGPASEFTVDFKTLKSDDEDRDFDVQENILETAKFSQGSFVPKEFRGLPKPLPASGQVKGQLAGDLTVHGVTKPAVFDVDGRLDDGTFRGKGVTDVLLTDYGMQIPTLAVLLQVDNKVHAEITLTAKAE